MTFTACDILQDSILFHSKNHKMYSRMENDEEEPKVQPEVKDKGPPPVPPNTLQPIIILAPANSTSTVAIAAKAVGNAAVCCWSACSRSCSAKLKAFPGTACLVLSIALVIFSSINIVSNIYAMCRPNRWEFIPGQYFVAGGTACPVGLMHFVHI